MVIKGNARGGAISLADHLLRTDTNEVAELRELRGVAAEDLEGALREMEAVACGARSARHFYHASINTPTDEVMTSEQWQQAIDRLEQELELTGQPRAVVAHVKEGRAHVHIAWSRIDGETLRAIPDSFNYLRHELVARELEEEFGHRRVQGAHIGKNGDRPDRTPSHAEMQQAGRSGLDPHQAKAQLTEIWNRTDSGKAFCAAAEEEGWAMARGDRRDFVLVDLAGEPHSLAKRIEGAKAKDVRARMSDVDAASLPSVEEAKALQRERLRAINDAATASTLQVEAEPAQGAVSEIEPKSQAGSGGMSDHPSAEEAARLAEEEEIVRRRREAEAQRQAAEAPEPALEVQAQRNLHRQAEQLTELEGQRRRLDEFETARKQQAEQARLELERKREAEARSRQSEGEIRDAGDRYRVALGQHYDVANPYGSLARAAMAEYGAFIKDRESLNAQIAAEQDPTARQMLTYRRDIEGADYMALTSHRIASQSETITGRADSPEALQMRERATSFESQSSELRQSYRKLVEEKALQPEPQREAQAAHTKDASKPQRRPEGQGAPLTKEQQTRPLPHLHEDQAKPSQALQPESSATKEAKEKDRERSGDEMTDAKAERIARLENSSEAFDKAAKERKALGLNRGGRSR